MHPEPDHPAAIEIDVGADFEGNPQVFRLPWQKGPAKEVGRNGAQADEVLEQVNEYLRAFLPRENTLWSFGDDCTATAVFHIQLANDALKRRTLEREARGVEGTAQA